MNILNNLESKNESISEVAHEHTFTPTFSANDRTRSFFKIQDGCDYFCTYCAIPYARGRSRSETIEKSRETFIIKHKSLSFYKLTL